MVKSKIHPADNFDVLKMLVYGQNGKGKTRFGASGPRDVLLVDCNERGSLSIRKFPGVEVFKAEVWTDIDLAFWHLHSGNHNYQTVVLDTVTAAAQLCMRFVLGDESSRDPTKDPDMPGKREWGKVGELMKTLILNFRNLDMHVIFLAQERRGFTEDEDEAPEIFPDVSPSVRTTLTASVDIIGHVFTKEVVKKGEKGKGETVASYRMLIGPSERYITKDRSESGLPPLIALGDNDDNLEKLVERIKKGA
jgi:hypothetical protein